MNKNKLYALAALTTVLLLLVFGTNFFVEKVADRVVEKLRQDYSPSPYGPTIDPDKIDLNKVNLKVSP